ncbi:MAG: ThiF family adenylyltransferase [Bacteroidota bacterium]
MSEGKKTVRITKEWDKTFQLISWWKAEDVRKARILVVGAGALGNEVLKNLALLNVGEIYIVDFDTIEYSNLSRSVLFRESDCDRLKADVAAERVREINPNVKVQTIEGDIMLDVGIGLFRRMDVVIGCLDNRLARLYINRHCHKVGITWVDGAIENLAGQLDVYIPGISCYESNLSEADWANIRIKIGCPDIAARNKAQGRIPTTPISSSIIAAMQVQEALKIVMGNQEASLAGKRFIYEGMTNTWMDYKTGEPKDDAVANYPYDPIIEATTLTSDMTVGETLEWLQAYFEHDEVEISLDYEVILEAVTYQSEEVYTMVLPKPHLRDAQLKEMEKIPGEEVVITEEVSRLDASFPHLDKTLREVGIAPLQILKVRVGNDTKFVELTGDEGFMSPS